MPYVSPGAWSEGAKHRIIRGQIFEVDSHTRGAQPWHGIATFTHRATVLYRGCARICLSSLSRCRSPLCRPAPTLGRYPRQRAVMLPQVPHQSTTTVSTPTCAKCIVTCAHGRATALLSSPCWWSMCRRSAHQAAGLRPRPSHSSGCECIPSGGTVDRSPERAILCSYLRGIWSTNGLALCISLSSQERTSARGCCSGSRRHTGYLSSRMPSNRAYRTAPRCVPYGRSC
jgi:hypothetical protein